MAARLKRLAWVIAAGAAGSVLAPTLRHVEGVSQAETRPSYGGRVEGSLLGAPGTFDPAFAQTHAERTVAALVFDGLYRLGAAGAVRPALALEAPWLDAAGTTARIALRPGVVFHDGTLLTPADVVASLERARSGPSGWLLAPIAKLRVDGNAIEVVLRAPTPLLATLLAMPQLGVTKAGRAPTGKPIGTGAFAVDALDVAGAKLTLRAHEAYFAGRPYLDELVLRWYDTPDGEARQFETGAAQLSARGVAAFSGAQPKYRSRDVEGPGALLVYVGFGRAHADVLREVAFRRALDLALPRGALATVTSGERVVPSRGALPVEAGGSALTAVATAGDLSGAQAALGEAAIRVPALGAAALPKLSLAIMVDATRPDDREIAERVARALDKLGIGSTVTAVSATQFRERIAAGTTDLYIGQLAAPATAAWAWWGEAFAAGDSSWAAQQLAHGVIDGALAAREFSARLPILPLLFRGVRLWHRTDVHGLAFDASGVPSYGDVFLFGAPAKSAPP